MGEGWVSYYTELMRTRMGHRSEQTGWEKLGEAFDRGRRGGRMTPLGETSERMHENHAYQRVYWGGAAIAFLIDVKLRTETNGETTFDDAMQHLRECCGDADHQWTARQLLDELDGWYGQPVFSDIAAQCLSESDFPPVEEAFATLGISFGSGGRVVVDDDNPNAAHRRAIMAPVREP
jgi:predicted metalloprotease with PDZ domain